LWLSANIQYTPAQAIVQPPMHAQAMIGHSQLPGVLQVNRSGGLPTVNFSIAALVSDDGEQLTVRVVNLNASSVTAAVRKTFVVFEAFSNKNDHLNKTGSGQTQEKLRGKAFSAG
jgi:hypothetical protein